MTGRKRTFDDRGQILIMTAFTLVAIFAIAGLSLDVSYMYEKRNRLQAAADAGAKSAAMELQRNSAVSLSTLQAFANQQVIFHGFDPAGTTTVTVNHPPASGAFSGNANYVEVMASEVTSSFLMTILGRANMTPGARAVAGTSSNLACLITLEGPGTSPYSLEMGNTTIALNGCNAADGGDLNGPNPNSTIDGTPIPSVGIVGSCTGTCGNCATPSDVGCMGSLITGAPAPTDPLAGLPAPPQTGVNCPAGAAGTAATLSPGCYTSISSSVTTLNPGIYYITGTLDIGNPLSGTGVMLYLTGAGHLTSGNNQSMNLSAPTSGTYSGIAIFQNPSDTNNFSTGNHFTLNLDGAVYMPGVDVDIANHLSFTNTNCTLFIAHSLNIRNGDGGMSNGGCAATYGGAAFLSTTIAE